MRVLVTGASRGIGAAVARAFAQKHGADATIAVLGRSLSEPSHGALSGTLLETMRAVESFGAGAIPLQANLRCAEETVDAVRSALRSLGGLDVLVNNASALDLQGRTIRQMDLVHQVNARATLLMNTECRGALEESSGSVVTMSPPIRLGRLEWISPHPAYTVSKYSMTLSTLAFASERVRANCLWPRYTVATSATRRLERLGAPGAPHAEGRPAEDVALAVYALATSTAWNAQTLFDDDVIQLPPTRAPLDLFATDEDPCARLRGCM